jgi:hypothetical protein
MKKMNVFFNGSLASLFVFTLSCFSACSGQEKEMATATVANEQYPEIPREQLVKSGDADIDKLYAELQVRFTQDLDKVLATAQSMKAKPVFVFMTPEFANNETPMNRKGRAVIADYCKTKNVEFYDFTSPEMPLGKAITANPNLAITQMPKDGHWSATGAQLVTDCLAAVVDKNTEYKSNYTHTGAAPKVMGPHKPSENTVLDGGKDLPYRFVTNTQGFRNTQDFGAKSDKQRIMLLGDSEMFFPFLDHEQTATGLLEKKYANKEFINGANWGFSVNDYVKVLEQSASLSPDVLIIGLNGGDIVDYYFNHRIRFSMEKKEYKPSETEVAVYNKLFKK